MVEVSYVRSATVDQTFEAATKACLAAPEERHDTAKMVKKEGKWTMW
jgi:hypothetical protein